MIEKILLPVIEQDQEKPLHFHFQLLKDLEN